MSRIHAQLKESIRKLEQIHKIEMHITSLTKRLATEEKALKVMEKTLAKEQRDVEKLEQDGLTAMFRKFIGDREEKLEKEREDYLRASLRFNELFKSVELIHFELDLLEKKKLDRESVEKRIEDLMRAREQELLKLNTAESKKLRSIHQQADKLSKFSIEVEEAYNAGGAALKFVTQTENYLLSAKRMTQQRVWTGHRGNSGRARFAAIDQARNAAYQSRHALIRFGEEIKDVYADYELRFDMTIADFGNFANIFFDSLITDYFVQQKISQSLVNVTATRKLVEDILNHLNVERGRIADKEKKLNAEREEIIIGEE